MGNGGRIREVDGGLAAVVRAGDTGCVALSWRPKLILLPGDGDDGDLFHLLLWTALMTVPMKTTAMAHVLRRGRNHRASNPSNHHGAPSLPLPQLILLARGYKGLEEDSRCKAAEAARLLMEAETQNKLLQEKVSGVSAHACWFGRACLCVCTKNQALR